MVQTSALLAVATLFGAAAAHPGHDAALEALERRQFLNSMSVEALSFGKRSVSELCDRDNEATNIARRERIVRSLRDEVARKKKRDTSLDERDLDTVLNTTHYSTSGYNLETEESVIFASNATCILGPDVTQGPYYVSGELVRSDLTEDQEGIPMYMDVQLVDYNTCEAIPEVYIDFWHCNATVSLP